MPALTTTPLDPNQIDQFHRDGFLVVDDLLTTDQVDKIVSRFDPLFAGEFETGVYPDEWHWNPYLGKPGAAGQMTGVWKCDRTVAAAMLSTNIGQMAATLNGWDGARLLADGIWQKPKGATETTLHQDSMYINYHTPPGVVTCWIALSHAVVGASTIEYARGSHRWQLSAAVPEFHNQHKRYRSDMEQAARAAGVTHPDVVQLTLAPGSGVFHHGNTWHGSGKNTMDVVRRSLVMAYVPAAAQFKSFGAYVPGGYIAGKYRRHGDNTMDESFFPLFGTKVVILHPTVADGDDEPMGARCALLKLPR